VAGRVGGGGWAAGADALAAAVVKKEHNLC